MWARIRCLYGSTETEVAPLMNVMHSFLGIGALIAPIVVAQTAINYLTTNSCFVLAVLLLPVASYTIRLPSPIAAAAKHEESQIVNARLVFLLALFLFLYVGAEVGFAGWIFTYAVDLKLSKTVFTGVYDLLYRATRSEKLEPENVGVK